MKYTHIAFDIDGTLTNSEFACLQSLQDTLEQLTGSAPAKEALTFSLGIPGVDTLRQLGIPDIPAAFQLWEDNLRKYGDTITLFPGIPELLEELEQRGCRLGVVTSQTKSEYEEGFACLPTARHFTTLVRAGETARPKPSPDPLLRYMELAGCRPDKLLFVGDREGDLRCARGAGVDYALAGWGNPTGQMEADYRLEKPEDLLKLL